MNRLTNTDFVAIVKNEDAERRSLSEITIGAHRIDVELIEQLRFRAPFGGVAFTIDEPSERGGTGAGLPPLAFFLAGAASCLMTQYAKLAIAEEVTLISMRATTRGHLDRRIRGAFQDIIHEIAIESPASADTIKKIAREAELMCYVHNTQEISSHADKPSIEWESHRFLTVKRTH